MVLVKRDARTDSRIEPHNGMCTYPAGIAPSIRMGNKLKCQCHLRCLSWTRIASERIPASDPHSWGLRPERGHLECGRTGFYSASICRTYHVEKQTGSRNSDCLHLVAYGRIIQMRRIPAEVGDHRPARASWPTGTQFCHWYVRNATRFTESLYDCIDAEEPRSHGGAHSV